MRKDIKSRLVSLDPDEIVWDHCFLVSPLVVIGTKEAKGYNLAPKHQAMPLGHGRHYGFVCTPAHSTWQNVLREEAFSVSFPQPNHVTIASLAASPRCGEGDDKKPIISSLPTFPAQMIDAPLLDNCYLYLECKLERIIEGFDDFGMIIGNVVAAHIRPDSLKSSERDESVMLYKTPVLAYLAYGRFAEIRETFAFPMPKGFKL